MSATVTVGLHDRMSIDLLYFVRCHCFETLYTLSFPDAAEAMNANVGFVYVCCVYCVVD